MTTSLRIKEIKAERVLNPTSIDLGEAVINPYRGCELSCVYCYVKTNRSAASHPEPWGSYVDIRINTPELLEKELETRKISTVLLGSTTELFQPIEKKYHLARRTLEILNRRGIHYVILTRAPEIVEALPLLTQGFCKKIYFTVNLFDMKFKRVLEPKSADFKTRSRAIETLMNHGVEVITYFCPVLPWISNYEQAFDFYPRSNPLEFEFLNFTLKHIDEIIGSIASVHPEIANRYHKMQKDRDYYTQTWNEVREKIKPLAEASGKKYRFFEHHYEGFFENRYQV